MPYPVAAAKGRSVNSSVPANGLLNGLIAYWPINEASSTANASDLHSNGLTLTRNAISGKTHFTVQTGITYSNARDSANTNGDGDSFYRASSSTLQAGDVELTLAIWIYTTDNSKSFNLGKASQAQYKEYEIRCSSSAARFLVGETGNDHAYEAATAAPLSNSAWHLVVGWHDPTANKVYVQVDNGTVYNTSVTTGVGVGTGVFTIFATYDYGKAACFGRANSCCLWKSAVGGGGVLTTAKRTALYNAGAGLTYAQFTN